MHLDDVIWCFELGSVDDKRIIPFLQKTLPYLINIARSEAAHYYEWDDVEAWCQENKGEGLLKQRMIIKYLMKYRDYDAIEVSKIVEHWRKEYGVNERTSNRCE
jgi:protoporphyrinogen oxidase